MDIAPVIFAPDHVELPPLPPHDRQHAAVSSQLVRSSLFRDLALGQRLILMAIVTLVGWMQHLPHTLAAHHS